MNLVRTMAKKTKDYAIQFRVTEDVREDLIRLAEMSGLSVSALIHSTIVRLIREAKTQYPEAFDKPDTKDESK